jgi:hypothetical protein
MPKIERWNIDKVLDATSIVEVISEFEAQRWLALLRPKRHSHADGFLKP